MWNRFQNPQQRSCRGKPKRKLRCSLHSVCSFSSYRSPPADFVGLVDQLLQTLKEIDPSRGDRLDDRPEVEVRCCSSETLMSPLTPQAMYQDSVKLQGQINALIKKYSDQKGEPSIVLSRMLLTREAELEHMNTNFNRAMRQYEEMRTAPPPMPQMPQHRQSLYILLYIPNADSIFR